MKNICIKLLCIFAFILSFVSTVFAADFNITSVTYDNSSAFLTINTFDNEDVNFSASPKLYIVPEEQKAYFDINSAVLKCPAQELVVNSPGINQIAVKQFSLNPDVVRVLIRYNEGYNPKNIQLKKLNNTLFVWFRQPQVQNYYFQQVYGDVLSGILRFYESISIQIPVISNQNNIMNQINSAFNISGNAEPEYVLTKKDVILPTKYYLDNVNVKNGSVHITGNGSVTLSKPFMLSNPSRIVYDVPNAFVNSVLRNKDITINQEESIKVGQFNRDTARIVITSPNADKYIPVIYGDAQRVAFINKSANTQNSLFSTKTVLTSMYDEVNDASSHSIKLVFSKPVIYALDRTNNSMNLLLYNAEKSQSLNMHSILPGSTVTALNSGGLKLSIPLSAGDNLDIHAGNDAKTLRIKVKSDKLKLPEIKEEPVVATISPVKNSNKKYIVIDPGHGGSDHGAIRNNISEKNITLDISKRVQKLLEKKGYEVYMTRETDETVSLQERVDISENVSPDIFVSIHVNSSNSESPHGLETHYYKNNSLLLAKTVHASLLNNISANNRGLFKSKFYVINHTTAPAILVEIGFLSNPSERAQLVTESRKQATAKAIAEGINDYFK